MWDLRTGVCFVVRLCSTLVSLFLRRFWRTRMVHKRPFGEEDSYEGACKYPRQLEHTNELVPVADIVPFNYASQKPQISDDEGEECLSNCQDEERIASDSVAEFSNGTDKDIEIGAPGSISSFLLINGSAIEPDAKSEAAIHLSFFPEYFESDHQLRAFLQSDETYSSPLGYSPRKLFSVGPEHQAYVPEQCAQSLKNSSDHLDKSDPQDALLQTSVWGLEDDDVNGNKRMGTCVIPIPDFEASANYCCKGGGSRSDCRCLDGGSIRCVRQHVMEARGKLRENLGQEMFEELGFCDMGEEVVKKWTEEEERAFHEVVLSNPASLGRNFWDPLSVVFPSRTRMDFVSYYFNVFMLRKRAEQNRFDSLNIDSDDDEWQRSELGMAEEDEDSVVESPFSQSAPVHCQEDQEEDCQDENGIDACKDGDDFVIPRDITNEEDEGGIEDISEAQVEKSLGDGSVDPYFWFLGPSSKGENYDIQDDSCTSYEYQFDKVD